jgi:hypothetical protein
MYPDETNVDETRVDNTDVDNTNLDTNLDNHNSNYVITILDKTMYSPYTNIYCGNTTPVHMSESNNGSNSSSDLDTEFDDYNDLEEDGNSETKRNDIKSGRILNYNKDKSKYKPFTYNDIVKTLNKYYDIECKYSNELDILITYLNGQKNVYIHSHYITQQYLNILNIPCLLFTAAITIFAPFIFQYFWSAMLVSILNAIVAFFITMISYLKLESSAEMYLHISRQYERLETSLEMASNQLMYIENTIDQDNIALVKIKEFETQINEIKDMSTILIPISVKRKYPIISYINIFSFIKKMEIYKKNLIMKFKDIKNEINYILYKWKTDAMSYEMPYEMPYAMADAITDGILLKEQLDELNNNKKKEKVRLDYLYDEKDKIKNELVQYKNAYNYIDELFMMEIKRAETSKSIISYFMYSSPPTFEKCNPIIDKYLKSMFTD